MGSGGEEVKQSALVNYGLDCEGWVSGQRGAGGGGLWASGLLWGSFSGTPRL